MTSPRPITAARRWAHGGDHGRFAVVCALAGAMALQRVSYFDTPAGLDHWGSPVILTQPSG